MVDRRRRVAQKYQQRALARLALRDEVRRLAGDLGEADAGRVEAQRRGGDELWGRLADRGKPAGHAQVREVPSSLPLRIMSFCMVVDHVDQAAPSIGEEAARAGNVLLEGDAAGLVVRRGRHGLRRHRMRRGWRRRAQAGDVLLQGGDLVAQIGDFLLPRGAAVRHGIAAPGAVLRLAERDVARLVIEAQEALIDRRKAEAAARRWRQREVLAGCGRNLILRLGRRRLRCGRHRRQRRRFGADPGAVCASAGVTMASARTNVTSRM